MKFVVDESTGKAVSDFLKDRGFDTVYVGDKMHAAPDTEIMDFALEENRIIITNDKDFGRKVVKEGKNAEGIVLLRLKIEIPENKIEAIKKVLENYKEKLEGNIVVAKEDKIKLRSIS